MKSIVRKCRCLYVFAFILVFSLPLKASDWPRFRGPNGTGISADQAPLPTNWSDTENLKWKIDLPGPGSSCPIVVGDRVFLTCWSGYADGDEDGSLEDLKRHLVCIDRKSGELIWSAAVDAVLPEDAYRGMFAENGYATHTPTSDGENVYVFFGKSGVLAFDMDGKQVWKADVGQDRDPRGWGTASSPILYKNLLIVTASIENHAIVALDKQTGEEVWKQEADGFGSTWGTPVIVNSGERDELVIAVPYEFWSLNPETGKLLWYCDAISSDSMCSSVSASDDVVYGIEAGPRGGGAVAVRTGGKDNVSDSHVLWEARHRARVGTPVIHDGLMYFISSGVANCVNAKTGEEVYQERLTGSSSSSTGGRRGRGQDYSSLVIGDGKLFYVRRSGDVHVLKLGPKFEQVAVNRFDSDSGDYHATPAISNGEIFLRSSRCLYCIGKSEQ